jgi:hypothetical protein
MNPFVALRDGLSIPALTRRARTLDGSATPPQLVEIAQQYPAIAMQQHTSEFLELAELVQARRIRTPHRPGSHGHRCPLGIAQALHCAA